MSMAMHTGKGDDGFTQTPGPGGPADRRVRKDAPAPSAGGALDELNAAIGLCLAEANRTRHVFVGEALRPVQGELLRVASAVAAAVGGAGVAAPPAGSAVARMQRDIDTACADLPALSHFILPGGCELACRLHLARTVARRAEREVIRAIAPAPDDPPAEALRYLNRLSDLLFALARLSNRDSGDGDASWRP